VRDATGSPDGMASIAYELRVLHTRTPVLLVAASGVDTIELLLPKDRGKPKLRVFAFERQGDRPVRVAQANSMGKHKHLGIVQLQQPPGDITTRSSRVLTAAADGDGQLRVEVWDVRE
jgi:hypothetical protein